MKIWPDDGGLEKRKALKKLLFVARSWFDSPDEFTAHNLRCAIYDCEDLSIVVEEQNRTIDASK